MPEPQRAFADPSTLFGRLRGACPEEWAAFTGHEFVRRLGEGSLSEACFRHYLEQDYLFLIHFARAWALAVVKAESFGHMQSYASTLHDLLHREMALHVQYCSRWGLTREEMERVPEARANLAYTRFVLDRGLAGDVLDLQTALAPCVVGYAEIGARLAAGLAAGGGGNPYRDWVEAYGGEDYQAVADRTVRHLDELASTRLAPGRFECLAATFRQATVLEIGFWEMGLGLER